MTDYTMRTTLDLTPEDADKVVRDALSEEGFGILSVIDVQEAMQEKLGEDVGFYRILGACNPPLAFKALQADRDIGALLPCNVVLRDAPGGGTEVVAADPGKMLEIAGGDGVADIAEDARARIRRALDSLG